MSLGSFNPELLCFVLHLVEILNASLHSLTSFLEHLFHLPDGFVLESLDVGPLEVEPFSQVSRKLVETTISLLDILSNDFQLIVFLKTELFHVRFVSLGHQVDSDPQSKSSDDGLMETAIV